MVEDEEVEAVASDATVHPRFPDPDPAALQDNYYANLYEKDVDFRSLSRQDAEFAAMYGSVGSPSSSGKD